MGESSAFLMRSFSQPSPTSSEENKGNPIQRALTTSISFGRYMSESLDWGKWSAFTHNRYLEEVEKCSRPGTVAEKKAYFEAHFKRRRAAALLEQQQNVEANISSETNRERNVEDTSSTSGLGIEQSGIHRVSGDTKDSSPVIPVGQNGNFGSSVGRMSEDAKRQGSEKVTEPLFLKENLVELTNKFENEGCFGDIVAKISAKLSNNDKSSPVNSACEKKLEVSSSKLLEKGGASKYVSPVKVIKPVQLRISGKTPDSKRRDSSNKRRSYATSLHASLNFAPYSGPIQKGTPSDLERSRIVRGPAKKYKNSVETSTKASVNGLWKHHPAENKRTMRPQGDLISETRTMDVKVQSTSSINIKPSNIAGIKARVPTVPSSFTFKSEERAAKRREFFQKLEQRLKVNETEKHQILAKPQVNARSTSKDIRNSIALETTKNAEFPSRSLTKKVARGRPLDKESRPVWRTVSANNKIPYSSAKAGLTNKNENSSPNIQL